MSGLIRKYYDIGPAALVTTSVYSGGTTGFASGIADSNSVGSSCWLTSVSQSDDGTGRVGQSIAVETLDIRVKIQPDNTLAGHGHLRMIIFADNEADGALPTAAELLNNATVATGAALSWLNPSYFGRFKVIEDKNFQWYNSSTANSFEQRELDNNLFHESHHDMKDHRVMWDNTNASAAANIRKGHIFSLFIYENTVVGVGGIITISTTNPPGIQFTSRIRYKDL